MTPGALPGRRAAWDEVFLATPEVPRAGEPGVADDPAPRGFLSGILPIPSCVPATGRAGMDAAVFDAGVVIRVPPPPPGLGKGRTAAKRFRPSRSRAHLYVTVPP